MASDSRCKGSDDCAQGDEEKGLDALACSQGRRAATLNTRVGLNPAWREKLLRHKNEKEKSSGAIPAKGMSVKTEA
jgi:hypothetical protein